mmetsp:Transcript_19741/g.35779  ORF Transcript_19741/g.35779 Transcript_19741/m.35779 type:complete len:392 (-) Transcript_19741:128-1303(-)
MAAALSTDGSLESSMAQLHAGWFTGVVEQICEIEHSVPTMLCCGGVAIIFLLCMPLLQAVMMDKHDKAESEEGSPEEVTQAATDFHSPTDKSLQVAPLALETLEEDSSSSGGTAPELSHDAEKMLVAEPMRRAPSSSFAERRQRKRPPCMLDIPSAQTVSSLSAGCMDEESSPLRQATDMNALRCTSRRQGHLELASSSATALRANCLLSPGTPNREALKLITGDASVVFFDFDGTLTATPGMISLRYRKQVELKERAPMLSPRLKALREAGKTLCIISKSTEGTIKTALDAAGISDYFNGPIVAKAVGLEGKAGFIKELVTEGQLRSLFTECADPLRQVLLIDDDVYELDRAFQMGIQTYSAPQEGGLQEEDFNAIFHGLGLAPEANSAC